MRSLLAAALLLIGSIAVARPGGGQSFHAPSHSSGGSFSGSHSYSGGTYYGGGSTGAPATPLTYAIVALVAAIIVAAFVYNNFIKPRQRAGVAVEQDTREIGLAQLRAQDPAFDPVAFAGRTAATMARVNEAWLGGTMAPARRLVSDGVYVRFQTQLGLLRASGVRNAMADWRVVGAEVIAAEADALWDTVHVRVVGEARDADLPLALPPDEARRRLAHAALQRYEEVWSFVRRRGQKSRAGVPALEGRCPSCGADLPLAEAVRCDYCKALVNSGEHDWVLAEITQPEVWRPGAAMQQTPGLDQVRARDTSLSRQELEDRASVVFWKWIEARVAGSRARLDRFCVAPGHPPAPPAPLSQVAVGSADLVLVTATPDGRDRAHVDIVWSATVAGAARTFVDRVVLVRSSSVVSRRGLSSLDCPNCNGPLAESDAVRCDYCGAPLGGGQHEWSLEAVAERAA